MKSCSLLFRNNRVATLVVESGLPDWPWNGQFKKFGNFLTALAMKKCIWPFCEIWSFFQFVTVKVSFHLIFCLFVFFRQSSCPSLLQWHRGTSTFYCFEVCINLNDLALAVSRICIDVSVSDNLLVTIGI